ncbi:MAG: hypothetical protein MJ177_10460, partial [Clostridia bacterium]|nr:hypothetical protein [Clostridia bacterium]
MSKALKAFIIILSCAWLTAVGISLGKYDKQKKAKAAETTAPVIQNVTAVFATVPYSTNVQESTADGVTQHSTEPDSEPSTEQTVPVQESAPQDDTTQEQPENEYEKITLLFNDAMN